MFIVFQVLAYANKLALFLEVRSEQFDEKIPSAFVFRSALIKTPVDGKLIKVYNPQLLLF